MKTTIIALAVMMCMSFPVFAWDNQQQVYDLEFQLRNMELQHGYDREDQERRWREEDKRREQEENDRKLEKAREQIEKEHSERTEKNEQALDLLFGRGK